MTQVSVVLSLLVLIGLVVAIDISNFPGHRKALERSKRHAEIAKFSNKFGLSDHPSHKSLTRRQGALYEENCCRYSNPDLPGIIDELNQFILESYDNFAFCYGSEEFVDFTTVAPDYETEFANNAYIASLIDLRTRTLALTGLGSLEIAQLSPYVAELDYAIDLMALDARFMQYGIYWWDFSWINDPWMTVADTIVPLMKHTAEPQYVVKVLEWLGNLQRKMNAWLPQAQRILAAGKVHPSVVLEWQYDLEYGPYGFKYAYSIDFAILCNASVFTVPADLASCQARTADLETKQAEFLTWWDDVYRPAAATLRPDDKPGLWNVPQGQEIYDVLKKYHLGYVANDLDVYNLGNAGVAEIMEQYVTLGPQIGDDLTTVESVLAALSNPNDARFYLCTDNPQEAINDAYINLAIIAETLPNLFGFLPRVATQVTMTGSGSTYNSAGQYNSEKHFWQSPSIFNVGQLGTCGEEPTTPVPNGKQKKQKKQKGKEVPTEPTPQKYYYDYVGARSTSAHEGMPGHANQVPLSIELECSFSQLIPNTMFVEGWALHAEFLGIELGFYDTPTTLLGHYQSRALRDNRLREDTCLNSNTAGVPHCSTEEAMDLMISAGFTESFAFLEMERYLIMPAQALGYRLGDINLRAIREYAETELGELFDARDFYNIVLRFGGGDIETEIRPLIETYVKFVLEEAIAPEDFGSDIIPSQMYSTGNPVVGLGVDEECLNGVEDDPLEIMI